MSFLCLLAKKSCYMRDDHLGISNTEVGDNFLLVKGLNGKQEFCLKYVRAPVINLAFPVKLNMRRLRMARIPHCLMIKSVINIKWK